MRDEKAYSFLDKHLFAECGANAPNPTGEDAAGFPTYTKEAIGDVVLQILDTEYGRTILDAYVQKYGQPIDSTLNYSRLKSQVRSGFFINTESSVWQNGLYVFSENKAYNGQWIL